MSESLICPFCGKEYVLHEKTHISYYIDDYSCHSYLKSAIYNEYQIRFEMCVCPSCQKPTVLITGLGDAIQFKTKQVFPEVLPKHYPDYIPKAIREDYEEAVSILTLSPKASATLARRCLQGMIRDFWGISERTLYLEIDQLKDKISNELWRTLDAVREIGNIGAHMEQDVNIIVEIEEDEAEKLIRLIEHLFEDWYIKRQEQDELYNEIIEVNQEKQKMREQEDT